MLHYFGPWSDPDAALANYLEQKDALYAGRKPQEASTGATVHELANASSTTSRRSWTRVNLCIGGRGRLQAVLRRGRRRARQAAPGGRPRSQQLRRAPQQNGQEVGCRPAGHKIQCVRNLFKHGFEAGLVDRPMRFGPGFKRLSKKVLRLQRAKQGPPYVFTAVPPKISRPDGGRESMAPRLRRGIRNQKHFPPKCQTHTQFSPGR
jgi:hypothetical protein